ncbi:MAG TPA: serine/threonine-protein kinase [Kofleriaceae bacterium]|nr:serine/threonine-protein kinase [Kofleriaceae bacterium]
MADPTGAPAAFGRYRVRDKLGAGGMGAVYLARDDALDRDVAIKVLRPLIAHGGMSDELVERFRREARAVALVSHPNVVRVYDQGIEEDVPYLVMELVTGPTLASRLAAGGVLPVGEMRTLGIQIASALASAHQAGVVHRDVKPSNILQAEPGTWKLADFGIAHTADSELTITGQFLGTPSFAAPEALEGRPVGPAADVYSLAATLYAGLTGEPPFGDANLAQLVLAHATRRPTPIGERRVELPPSIAAAIDRALSVAPDERPTATELARALAVDERASGDRAAVAPPAAQVAPAAEATAIVARGRPVAGAGGAPSSRRIPRPFLIGAIAGGALAIGIAIATSDGDGAPPGVPAAALPMTNPAAADAPAADIPAAAGPPGAAASAPGDQPPWATELPPALVSGWRGRPSDKVKRWRKAYEKLREGDWNKGADELYKILDHDPGDETARRWLEWLERAARDPRWSEPAHDEHEHEHRHPHELEWDRDQKFDE